MKLLLALAAIVGANASQWAWDEALLAWSSATADGWSRSRRDCDPVRVFEATLPLSQDCPRSTAPR